MFSPSWTDVPMCSFFPFFSSLLVNYFFRVYILTVLGVFMLAWIMWRFGGSSFSFLIFFSLRWG